MSGESRFNLYMILADLARRVNPTSYLEIGVADGFSLIEVVKNASDLQKLLLCDTWGTSYGGTGKGDHKHIERLLTDLKYGGSVNFLDGNSVFLKQLYPDRQFDMALVDGDHSYHAAESDLNEAWRLTEDDGIIIIDDLVHPSHIDLSRLFFNFCHQVSFKKQLIVETYCDRPNGVGIIYKGGKR